MIHKNSIFDVNTRTVHSLDYGVLSTTSVMLNGTSFGNVQSFSDGPESSGSGKLFFYVSDLDASMQDVKENATVSFTLSEEMIGNRCSNSFIDGHDAEDPRCVRLVMTGTWRFDLNDDERKLANESLFSRHPEMKTWPVDHHWQMGTIDVKDIWLIDIFGGASTIKVEDYDKVKAFTSVEKPSKSDPPSNPPAIDEKAQTARWLAHSADFGILSTTSVHLNGAPFGNPQSFCDGTTDNSTGKLYFYVSNLDASMQDVAQNDRVSFTLSEEFVHDSCMNQQIDPEDPRCVRLTFSGKIRDLTAGSQEESEAKSALFSRHPSMAKWPSDHNWKIVTLDIDYIWMIDTFGGASIIEVSDYYSA